MMPSTSSDLPLDNLAAPEYRIDLAVVLPTFNERENVSEIISRLDTALTGLRYEILFVDDDSPDGTADLVRDHARHDCRIRLLHRIGRRGLASACIEGILATSANYVAIMDADMQHDETILPAMLAKLRADSLDVVIATRNADGGSMGCFDRKRVLLSTVGKKIGHSVCRCQLSDPMSGFFLLNRSFFLETAHNLEGGGFKILVDIFASSPRTVRFGEVGYTFRNRQHGESKLDVNTGIEYLFLVVNKLMRGAIPLRFAVFSIVGATGVATHLACLAVLLYGFHVAFLPAQIAATYVAMTENFFLNNLVTYRDRSLRGIHLFVGMLSFWVACSFGAWANVIFARSLFQSGHSWYFAGLAGIVLSSVWNYSISNLFTWQMPKSSTTQASAELSAEPIEALSGGMEVYR